MWGYLKQTIVFGKFQSREEAFIGPLRKNPLSISTSRPDFTEDPSSDPTTHIWQLTKAYNSSSKECVSLFWLQWILQSHVHSETDT